MKPADRKKLRAAAALISEDAQLILESCQGQQRSSVKARWACGNCQKDAAGKCQAQRDYEARIAAHGHLTALANRAAA